MHVVHMSQLTPQRNTGDLFNGEVHSQMMVDESMSQNLRLNLVKFSAGGRTRWHTHSFEQGLIIVEGRGIVATEVGEQVVQPGDVVFVPANEKHWHGGGETSGMAHIAINGVGETTALEPVEAVRTPGV